MDKIVIFTRPSGSMSTISPAPEYRVKKKDLDDDEFMQHIIDIDLPAGVTDFAVVDLSELPTDRAFRNAWRKNGVNIRVDLPEARTIHQAKIDRIKNREMKPLVDDIVIQQALGNDVTALQAQIQGIQTAVDNVGPNINAAGTPAMLKAVWPAGLPTE